MNDLRSLFDRFWIVRSRDRELYHDVRRSLNRHRRFVNELLGWNLIVNESLIKLEKAPPRSMAWMGIPAFTEVLDYCLLCAVLLFLADLADEEQFLLSSLTAAVETYTADICPVDWTRFPHRKSLVRVLRYVQDMGLLLVYGGSSDGFGGSQEHEVLYENTGLSRHFAVHFGRDVSRCRTAEDFEAFSREGDADRGRVRVRRVYRQLALCPALYWSEGDQADYDYVKNERQWVGKYLDEALGGELQVYRNGAFFVLEEVGRLGAYHPRDLALCDVTLLLCAQLRAQVLAGIFPRRADDRAALTRREFYYQVARCRERAGAGWGSQLRAQATDRIAEELLRYMTGWMLLEERGEELLLCPAAAKWVGHYPKDYHPDGERPEEEGEEESREPLEDE